MTVPSVNCRGSVAAGQGGQSVLDGQSLPRRLNLTSIRAVRREMASIYELQVRGKLPVDQGARLIFQLQCIAKVIEVEKIEPAVEAWERQQMARR